MDTFEYIWIRLDTFGYIWIRLDTFEYIWILLNTFGYIWILLTILMIFVQWDFFDNFKNTLQLQRRSLGVADFRLQQRIRAHTANELVEEFWMAGLLLLLYGQNITTTSFPLLLFHLYKLQYYLQGVQNYLEIELFYDFKPVRD